MVIEKTRKKKDIYDTVISSCIPYKGLPKNLFGIDTNRKGIEFFESLPLGKELRKAFYRITKREGLEKLFINIFFKVLSEYNFMFEFYKTILISIDKRLKLSQDISVRDIKNAFYKTENKTGLKKVLSVFNCKTQNRYYEFSKNAVIELYAQGERLVFSNLLLEKEIEAKSKPRNTLKPGDPQYELYKEIIVEILKNKLDKKNITLTKLITFVGNRNNYPINGELYKSFFKWKREKKDSFKHLVMESLLQINPNLTTF